MKEGQFEEWCIADEQVPDDELQRALDWACGKGGADCGDIQVKRPCFYPNTVRDHASYAFNSYYQKFKHKGASCFFNSAAMVTALDPKFIPFKAGYYDHGAVEAQGSSDLRIDLVDAVQKRGVQYYHGEDNARFFEGVVEYVRETVDYEQGVFDTDKCLKQVGVEVELLKDSPSDVVADTQETPETVAEKSKVKQVGVEEPEVKQVTPEQVLKRSSRAIRVLDRLQKCLIFHLLRLEYMAMAEAGKEII
ncbi:Glucan endo-1,3-beta-glucosidase 12, partial [Cucurbita argyrosperma subsp. argyrosperma]